MDGDHFNCKNKIKSGPLHVCTEVGKTMLTKMKILHCKYGIINRPS